MPSLPPRLNQRTLSHALDSRESAARRGYGRRWRRFRLLFLSDNPLCADCQANGKYVPATEVHHLVKVAERPDLMFDLSNGRALCHACHSVRTARGE